MFPGYFFQGFLAVCGFDYPVTFCQTLMQEVDRARSVNHDRVLSVSKSLLSKYIEPMRMANHEKMTKCLTRLEEECSRMEMGVKHKLELLEALNPEKVLKQGYAILSGKISPGNVVKITTMRQEIEAEVKKVQSRD